MAFIQVTSDYVVNKISSLQYFSAFQMSSVNIPFKMYNKYKELYIKQTDHLKEMEDHEYNLHGIPRETSSSQTTDDTSSPVVDFAGAEEAHQHEIAEEEKVY